MITRNQAKLIHRLKSRKRRDREDAFLVEGVRLVEELFASGLKVELLVTSPGLTGTARGRALSKRAETGVWMWCEVSDAELKKLADTEHPQGVLAVARRSRCRISEFEPADACALLVFDGVGDPGNLGTLIRSADALGVGWVVALPGTVDPWNPKAVRAAAGSLFRLPVSQEPWPEVVTWLRQRHFSILCADARGEPVPRSGPWLARFALVLGSEPAGPSDRVKRDCDRRVAVELREGVDSLNVAVGGALLLDRLLAGSDADRRA